MIYNLYAIDIAYNIFTKLNIRVGHKKTMNLPYSC